MRIPPLLLMSFVLAGSVAGANHARGQEKTFDPEPVVGLLELLIDADAGSAQRSLQVLATKIQTREISAAQVAKLRPRLEKLLAPILAGKADDPLYFDSALLAASWNNRTAERAVRGVLKSSKQPTEKRLRALEALVAVGDAEVLDDVASALSMPKLHPIEFRAAALAALGRLDERRVAAVVIENYTQLEEDLRPKAIELLTQRTAWSKTLLQAIGRGELNANALNANQVGKLLARGDAELTKLVQAKWGSVRTERNPEREKIVSDMRQLLLQTRGDARRGAQVFHKVCGQCHKIHGRGQEVGPDITSNGRASFDQLLSNVFDPSLVIGAAYQARTVITDDGRVLTGLLAEDNQRRLVLKIQGGKLETVPRDEVDEMKISRLSLMPEGLEKQLESQQLADLFAFLVLDLPPDNLKAKLIPGAPVFQQEQVQPK